MVLNGDAKMISKILFFFIFLLSMFTDIEVKNVEISKCPSECFKTSKPTDSEIHFIDLINPKSQKISASSQSAKATSKKVKDFKIQGKDKEKNLGRKEDADEIFIKVIKPTAVEERMENMETVVEEPNLLEIGKYEYDESSTVIPKEISTVELKTSSEESEVFRNETSSDESGEIEGESLSTSPSTSERSTEPSSTSSTTDSLKPTYVSSTEPPVTTVLPHMFKLSNLTNHICTCDLKLDDCDINCCCDKDCSEVHRQVFTHCEDIEIEHDSNFCYKSNFIYRNKTEFKLEEARSGLFCIVKDNLPSRFAFKAPPVITTSEEFKKHLAQSRVFKFDYSHTEIPTYLTQPYHESHHIWIIRDSAISTFGIPTHTIGLRCSFPHAVRFLEDYNAECSRRIPRSKKECEAASTLNMLNYVENLKFIVSPALINQSDIANVDKTCEANQTCVRITPYFCGKALSMSECLRNVTVTPTLNGKICNHLVVEIQYLFIHNGTSGIQEVRVYFWLKNVTLSEDQLVQRTGVRFRWFGFTEKLLQRSGNPGYITGKPLLAGRKLYFTSNDTLVKKEAIELSLDERNWLTMFGVDREKCSNSQRMPIRFRENGLFSCTLTLKQENFGKSNCFALQKTVLDLLTGEDTSNITATNLFNKYVGTFGNSKVEETGDWVQVLIDLYPVISSQVTFKSVQDNLICKNIITKLFINIAYANIGSFRNPQAKIIGVSYRFGSPKHVILRCERKNCPSASLNLRLYSSVNFHDLTEPAFKEFAEPPGIEAKLPHDFFYPFFSRSAHLCSSLVFTSICCLLVTFIS